MAFWSTGQVEPKRQFRFLVSNSSDDEAVWYWAKSVTKPSFEISTTEHLLVNHKFKYPSTLTWNDITMTIVDTGDKTSGLLGVIRDTGYDYPTDFQGTEGISKDQFVEYLDEFRIQQLDAEGGVVENWELKGAFIKSLNFGDLDYESDALVTVQLTIGYDWAELN
mgnify:CR=1 FL=1|jgi:hypothetical protein